MSRVTIQACGLVAAWTSLAAYSAADQPLAPSSAELYRFEKRVTTYAVAGGKNRLAAEAYFVGLIAVKHAGDERQIEEYTTGGLLSDLGEEIPPRPPSDPLRRNYVLNKKGEIVSPALRRNSLVVWPMLFEFFLVPETAPAELLAERSGVRQFSSHAASPAVRGAWIWQLEAQKTERPSLALYGPFSGKLDEQYAVGGSLGRSIDRASGAIRAASGDITISIPVSARLAALADLPERKAEEEAFFAGYETILIGETARLQRDADGSAGAIELPGSLSTALTRLRGQPRRNEIALNLQYSETHTAYFPQDWTEAAPAVS